MRHRLIFDSNSQLKSSLVSLELIASRMHRSSYSSMNLKKEHLSAIEKNLEYLSPEKVLRRGYSISSSGGLIIKNAGELKEGDELTTRFFRGGALSIVKKINKL
jgi:exodeoxyribonuclease VII large subunit